jgi:hypothetical protein
LNEECPKKALAIALEPNDAARLQQAFNSAWKKIGKRAGDPAVVRANLARLIVFMGTRRRELKSAALAKIVGRMFEAPYSGG